jgi:decaprenylphospho-beta-D-ribofuranose 2-oxidase
VAAERLVSGWGRASASRARLVRPRERAELYEILETSSSAGLVARGLGRSYGDAAQRAGGTVVDCTGLDRVLELDAEHGLVRVEAGCSFESLLRVLVPAGFFVPVTPGTRHVTIGGAIAADVHGKNHHLDGSFGQHLRAIELVTPTGLRRLSPVEGGELFDATTGGMGLTGVVVEATLSLLRIETAWMVVDTERARDLDDCMARMLEGDNAYRYSVAWVDCLAGGGHLGRGVLSRANHAPLDALSPKEARRPLAYDPRPIFDFGGLPPLRLLRRSLGRAFNEAWYAKAPLRRTGELQALTPFFHPLDGVGSWNRLYGQAGFTQYQLVVPDGAEGVVRAALERLAQARIPCYLAVLKRFGAAGRGHLSFPAPGWTLALDLPLGLAGLGEVLDGIDELVAASSGRVYLAKDGRVRPELIPVMYPRLGAWQAIRQEVDPKGMLRSDLGVRLGLCR